MSRCRRRRGTACLRCCTGRRTCRRRGSSVGGSRRRCDPARWPGPARIVTDRRGMRRARVATALRGWTARRARCRSTTQSSTARTMRGTHGGSAPVRCARRRRREPRRIHRVRWREACRARRFVGPVPASTRCGGRTWTRHRTCACHARCPRRVPPSARMSTPSSPYAPVSVRRRATMLNYKNVDVAIRSGWHRLRYGTCSSPASPGWARPR